MRDFKTPFLAPRAPPSRLKPDREQQKFVVILTLNESMGQVITK